MMIDASALVAILLREPEAQDLVEAIECATTRFTSPIAIYETVAALMRVKGWGAARAEAVVRDLLERAAIQVKPISDAMASVATQAFEQFGKGKSPAALNMGDCFAYACAKVHGAPLLFKGHDFGKTDVNASLK